MTGMTLRTIPAASVGPALPQQSNGEIHTALKRVWMLAAQVVLIGEQRAPMQALRANAVALDSQEDR